MLRPFFFFFNGHELESRNDHVKQLEAITDSLLLCTSRAFAFCLQAICSFCESINGSLQSDIVISAARGSGSFTAEKWEQSHVGTAVYVQTDASNSMALEQPRGALGRVSAHHELWHSAFKRSTGFLALVEFQVYLLIAFNISDLHYA